jgi:hypothetical protein
LVFLLSAPIDAGSGALLFVPSVRMIGPAELR